MCEPGDARHLRRISTARFANRGPRFRGDDSVVDERFGNQATPYDFASRVAISTIRSRRATGASTSTSSNCGRSSNWV